MVFIILLFWPAMWLRWVGPFEGMYCHLSSRQDSCTGKCEDDESHVKKQAGHRGVRIWRVLEEMNLSAIVNVRWILTEDPDRTSGNSEKDS